MAEEDDTPLDSLLVGDCTRRGVGIPPLIFIEHPCTSTHALHLCLLQLLKRYCRAKPNASPLLRHWWIYRLFSVPFLHLLLAPSAHKVEQLMRSGSTFPTLSRSSLIPPLSLALCPASLAPLTFLACGLA